MSDGGGSGGLTVDDDRRRAMTSARWARVVKFTVAEVDLNARGMLSWRQRLRCAGSALIALAVAVPAGLGALDIAQLSRAASTRPSPGLSLALGFVASLAGSLALGWYGSTFLQDAVVGRAAVAIGPLQFVWKLGSRGQVKRYLSCDGRRFDVRAGCRHAIDDDAIYRVYYTPCSGRLLSLEPIGPLPES